ncbi:MAG: hypothetical protein LC791_16670 [Acidobacteria bacterium]|nr:hypothetical protein [Acidobacteriota bacterium]
MFVLGRRTGQLHGALAALRGEGFGHLPLERAALQSLAGEMQAQAQRVVGMLAQVDNGMPEVLTARASRFRDLGATLGARFTRIGELDRAGQRIRTHGDFHLGQVLEIEGDFAFIDFEGEPTRPIAERRVLQSPLRDVAGMLRSFGYAAQAGLRLYHRTHADSGTALDPWATAWEATMGETYLRGYLATADTSGLLPDDPEVRRSLLQGFVLDKALYELAYELGNRPEWAEIPLDALLRLLDPASGAAEPTAVMNATR